jgi:hypothetical protein
MRTLKFTTHFILILFVAFVTGCLRTVKEHDIPGIYELRADWGTSTLTLDHDGTMEQTIRLKTGSVNHIRGKWSYVGSSTTSLGNHITLAPYLNCDHNGSGANSAYGSFSIIAAGLSGSQIVIDPDWNLEFRKSA